MELIKIKVNILEYLIHVIGDVIEQWQVFASQTSEISCRLLSTRYMAFEAGQQSYWQTRECLASSFQRHLVGGTHREGLRELGDRGENNREMSLLRIFETTEPNSSQRGAEVSPGRGIPARNFQGKVPVSQAAVIRGRQRHSGTGSGECSNGPASALGGGVCPPLVCLMHLLGSGDGFQLP